MSFIYFDSRDPRFKRPFGALRTGEPAEFSLHLPKNGAYTAPSLLLFAADHWDTPEVYPLRFARAERTCNVYSCTLTVQEPRLCFYTFSALQDGRKKVLSRAEDNSGVFVDSPVHYWQLTVYRDSFHTPDFLKGGILYQIFPDRFYNSGSDRDNIPFDRTLHENWYEMPEYRANAQGKITNSDYFCGDLRGITHKLDYLHGLGVTCLYLNPIFEAHSSHRYNTADYRRVDPLLGAEEDLRELCAKARALDIRVILDGVFSHTGDDSIYFNRQNRYSQMGAYNSKESPFFAWYDFTSWPDRYSSWWGFETLPNVNETNPAFLDYICGDDGVLRYWLSLGVSGFRLDVADELPDRFLDALTASVKAYNPEALVLGEVWEDASNKVAYGVRKRYFLGEQLDSVMNYPFKDAILSFVRHGQGQELNNVLLTILENYPKPVVDVLMNCLSTHDVERAITKLGGEPLDGHDRQWQMDRHFLTETTYNSGKLQFMLAQVLQFFLPGVPSVYYGDEVGMTGYRDPFNRCTFPWDAGDEELLEFTRNLAQIRGRFRGLLADAEFLPVSFDSDLYAFARVKDGEGLLVAVNRGAQAKVLLTPFAAQLIDGSSSDEVPAYSYLIAKIIVPVE